MENRNYYRVMLGKGSHLADQCYAESWIGGDWEFDFDLTDHLAAGNSAFKKHLAPIFLRNNPGRSKVATGLACGMLYTICRAIKNGDIVLCPDGRGSYYVGEVIGEYKYVPDAPQRHQRPVRWLSTKIDREQMSQGLRNSTGSIGTVSNIDKHADEIASFIQSETAAVLIATDELVEDPSVFALEQHLEEFMVSNWAQTELGKNYDIYEDEDGGVGRQFQTDTGRIDILAISKDRKELLVVELKKGRASDAVLGQVQRYMGDILEQYAEDGQTVRGAIIALEDDLKIKRALKVAPNIDFYRYQVSFKLFKSA